MLEALSGFSTELLRPVPLLYSTIFHRFFAVTERERFDVRVFIFDSVSIDSF
jgi:hypothetical protein